MTVGSETTTTTVPNATVEDSPAMTAPPTTEATTTTVEPVFSGVLSLSFGEEAVKTDGPATGQAISVGAFEEYDSDFLGEGKKGVKVLAHYYNGGNEMWSYNPYEFTLTDSDGFRYEYTYGVDQALSSGDLAPGDQLRGYVAFEIPVSASPESIIWQESVWSEVQVIWR
ncbi:MAG: DUF4352 domain-containing protein [Armatimonadetes bacterium]|nr:DUF4352 domain-containing protein [Armatimonadota bacterium]